MNVFVYAWHDLGKNRTRSLFAVGGVLVSIFLLSAVSILNDSLSYSYLDLATNKSGSSDIIFTRTIEADLNFDPFFEDNIIPSRLAGMEEINEFYPRIMMPVSVQRWDRPDIWETIIFYGLDVAKETMNDDLGQLWVLDENGTRVSTFDGAIPAGHCIVLERTAEELNVSVGDSINCSYTTNRQSFVIDAICEQDLKFTLVENNLIITDLDVAQAFFNKPGQINYVQATLANPERVYDSRDYESTLVRLRAIGADIQDRIGFDYQVTLPKLMELEISEYIMTGISTMFWFITLLSMLITGILINGILSTSVEERIREFGIFRTLGGRKWFNLRLILLEGVILSVVGTSLGVLLAITAVPWILPVLFDAFEVWTQPIPFIVLPESVFLSFAIGISISLVVSAFPALKTARIKITEAIQPFKHEQGQYKIHKEGSANTKAIVAGLSIATIGAILFIIFPQVIVSGQPALIVSIFVGLLFAILIGLVFASVAIIPAIEQGFSWLFRPLVKKYHPIIQTSLKRYRRRNTGTILMFAVSFAFIFFVTTRIEIDTQNTETIFEFQYGSDIVLVNRGQPGSGRALTKDIQEIIAEHPAVAQTAPTCYNTFDVQSILSVFDITGEGGGFDIDELSADMDMGGGGMMMDGGGGGGGNAQDMMNQMEGSNFDIMSLFGSGINKYDVEVSDLAYINDVTVGLVGVDREYVEISNPDYFTWHDSDISAFDTIFSDNFTCILGKSVADRLMKTTGDQVRFRVYDADGDELENTNLVFTIAGVSAGMPGYWNFRASAYSVWNGGCMVSMDTYARIMDWWPDAQLALAPDQRDDAELTIDKVFIQLNDHSSEAIQDFKFYLEDEFGDYYDFLIDDAITYINMSQETNQTISLIMEIILMFTVIICLFGLLASMYATILERTLEIGILRAIGMKSHEVRRMFLVESMCTLLAAGIMGMLIGSVTAYLLASQTALLTEVPVLFTPPWGTILRVFGVSIALGIGGMYGILRGLSRMTIMDIFRQTF